MVAALRNLPSLELSLRAVVNGVGEEVDDISGEAVRASSAIASTSFGSGTASWSVVLVSVGSRPLPGETGDSHDRKVCPGFRRRRYVMYVAMAVSAPSRQPARMGATIVVIAGPVAGDEYCVDGIVGAREVCAVVVVDVVKLVGALRVEIGLGADEVGLAAVFDMTGASPVAANSAAVWPSVLTGDVASADRGAIAFVYLPSAPASYWSA